MMGSPNDGVADCLMSIMGCETPERWSTTQPQLNVHKGLRTPREVLYH